MRKIFIKLDRLFDEVRNKTHVLLRVPFLEHGVYGSIPEFTSRRAAQALGHGLGRAEKSVTGCFGGKLEAGRKHSLYSLPGADERLRHHQHHAIRHCIAVICPA